MSIIFISHKLNEVLEIADRITVLRRGKTIETVPREGATEETLARAMVGREVLLRVDKPPAQPGDVAARGRGPRTSSTTAASRRCAASRFEVRAGEIVGIAGVDGNGQTELIDAITGLRKIDSGVGHGRRPRARATRLRARCSTPGVGHIPEDRQRRGLVLEFSIAENIALHDYAKPPDCEVGLAVPAAARRARARRLIKEFDVRGGGPLTRAGGALRRQPAEGRRRARDRARPEGADRRAADARPRRRRDRVPPPPARRRARRGPRDPAHLARARGDLLALRPHPRHLRGRDRRRAHAATSPRRRSASRCSAADGRRRRERPSRRRARPAARRRPPSRHARLAVRAAPARRRDRRARRSRRCSRS